MRLAKHPLFSIRTSSSFSSTMTPHRARCSDDESDGHGHASADDERSSLVDTTISDGSKLPEWLFLKVAWHVIPLLWVGYVLNIIDRTNLAYAQLQMASDLGLSPRAFGLASGIFFVAYALAQVPANHAISLPGIGATRVLSGAMLLWGAFATATGFVSSQRQLVVLRFCLGLAESAFFPGVLLYLTRWFPDSSSGRALAFFSTAASVGGLVSAAGSGILLSVMDGVGSMRGWRWLLILEGIPTIGLGLAAFLLLNEHPQQAKWLRPDERRMLTASLNWRSTSCGTIPSPSPTNSSAQRRPPLLSTLRETISSTPCAIYTMTYFVSACIANSARFFLPSLLTEVFPEMAPWQLGFIFAVPASFKVCLSPLVAARADEGGTLRRYLWTWALYTASATLLVVAGLGMLLLGVNHGREKLLTARLSALFIAMISLADVLCQVAIPVFWAFHHSQQPAHLRGCSIAVVNSVGNLGGFVGPFVLGAVHDAVDASAVCGKGRGQCMAQWGLGMVAVGCTTTFTIVATAAAIRQRLPGRVALR
jgi:sugar phosphate permease